MHVRSQVYRTRLFGHKGTCCGLSQASSSWRASVALAGGSGYPARMTMLAMTCAAATPTDILAGSANGAVHLLRLRS